LQVRILLGSPTPLARSPAAVAAVRQISRRHGENPSSLMSQFSVMTRRLQRCGPTANHLLFPCLYRRYPQGGALASYREMDAVGRDPSRFVLMAKQCLLFSDLTDWERDFLESLVARPPERLSTRQAEVLFEIRDDNELISDPVDVIRRR
jgi:hypothetical protein